MGEFTMGNKIKRSDIAHYLDTRPGTSSPTFNWINKGVSELTIDYGAETQSSQYIGEDTATTDTTGYTPTISVEQEYFKGDAVCEFVDDLRMNRALLSDCYTTLVNVYKAYEVMSSSTGTGEFYAEKQPASITINEFGGGQPDTPHLSYTINYRGDAIKGKFAPTQDGSGTFTAGTFDKATGTFTPAT
jgi:hypothetical protein